MIISHGEVWWADLSEPTGSGPGYRRPVIVVQCDALNQSRVNTVVCVPLTSTTETHEYDRDVWLGAIALDKEKKARLEAHGWKVGSAEEFLGLTPEEAAYIELRLKLRDQQCRSV